MRLGLGTLYTFAIFFMESTAQSLQWYAFRMSVRTPHEAQAIARREGFETYYALRKQLKDASYDTPTDEAFQDKPLLPSVIFVKCTEAFAQKMQDSKKMWPYRMPGEKSLCPITQRDIDVFRTAVESGCRNLEVIDENLAMGDKVRVLDGIFKDQEGYIVKIRGDKRFVISIPGVVAIATIYIPKHLLAPTPQSYPPTMQDTTSNNKRIAKNTIMLYIRMFISMVVGLYTSRVVLATLGVEDYGIYGVVGGVVAMMGFLNASMSGATSRFLTFELGRGDKDRLAKTFSSALIVHIAIAIIVFILTETVGLWFLCNKLNIPEGRMEAAHWVYQFSILSTMLSITQVPYNATIIAHEKMDVYAYMEILNVTLKLLIVYLLTIGDFDKLKLYAVLTFAVSLIIMMIYRIYCLRHFKESRFHWVWDKTYLTPLLSFSGWNLYGNFGGIAGNQANNFVINSFFGVVMNAAASVAFTVSGIVTQFSLNAMTAFRPQIIKKYASGDIQGMQSLTFLALKAIMMLYTLIAIPVFLECDYILSLWLVEVPQMASIFCKILLISIFFESMRYIIIINIHASGNVKKVSAYSGTLFCISPIISYFLFKIGLPVASTFITIATINATLVLTNVLIAKYYIPQIEQSKYFTTIGLVTFTSAISLLILLPLQQMLPSSFLRLCIMTCASLFLQLIIFAYVCLTANQRESTFGFIRNKLHI